MTDILAEIEKRTTLESASPDKLHVRKCVLKMGMSQLFEAKLTLEVENDNLDFEPLLGQPVAFRTIHGDHHRHFTGICAEIGQVEGVTESRSLSTYAMTLVPNLWLLTQRRNHRMFQQMSELDIVKSILDEWGIKTALHITAKYKTRRYRVQYAETDYAFISRMLEDAGISFYFDTSEDETTMVLSDAPERREVRIARLPYRQSGSDKMKDFVTALRVTKQVLPGKYTVKDHDYRIHPTQQPLSSHEEKESGVEAKLEKFHYIPGGFLYGTDRGDDTPNADVFGKTRSEDSEAKLLTQRRLRANRALARTVDCTAGAHDLEPGMVVGIVDHPRVEFGDKQFWLITASTFELTEKDEFLHTCRLTTAGTEYRPPLVTQKPKVSGVESATVVGSDGDEIHTDEFGRVRVHFHWDRESEMNERSSCWIHVVQPWGGTAYGGMNLPRVGQEVIVDFMGGDPDRPVITGRVYTNHQKVPYSLPSYKTRSAWKSDSSPGHGGFNEIMYEDLKGKELVYKQAEKNQRRLVKNDDVSTVGNDQHKLVKRDKSETVDKNQFEVTGGNRTEITDMMRTVMIGGQLSKLVQSDEIRKTAGNRQKTVEQNEHVVVKQNRREHVEGTSEMLVNAMRNEAIGAVRSLIVGNDDQVKVGRNHATEAGKEIHLKAGDQVVIEAGTRITIKGPGGFIDFHSGGIDIVGNLVRINSGGSAADGQGAKPLQAAPAVPATPEMPPKNPVDDVGQTGIAQDAEGVASNISAALKGENFPSNLLKGAVESMLKAALVTKGTPYRGGK
jgi:type VI secretion system secreted protein VgrG